MSFNYIYPTISSLPPGYDCTIILPLHAVAARLPEGSGDVLCTVKIFYNSEMVSDRTIEMSFKEGKVVSGEVEPIVAPDRSAEFDDKPGFLELSFHAKDEANIFTSKKVIGFYSIYTGEGKKSFFSDNAYKYGEPPIINQIAAFGRYVIGYPVIHVDKARNICDSLCLINPYHRPVVVRVRLSDGRKLKGIRIDPFAATYLRMSDILEDGQESWQGPIQLTASNRLVTYIVKHRFDDEKNISDHEHLDPFRGEETFMPATQRLRQMAGKYLER